MSLSFEDKYKAIGKKESLYEGQFVTAVTTTGIFCRPSCSAKKPKAENVIFYDSAQQALQNGFRPCKICRPMEAQGVTPDFIRTLIDELHADPFLRLKDYDLKKRNIEPNLLRRWFKKNHNMTFQCYQRMLRINRAYNQIKGGNSVTRTAFGVGYESLSAFADGYKNIFGHSPTHSKNKAVVNINRFPTALGAMFACATTKGICLLEFTDRRMLESEFEDICRRLDAVILPGANIFLQEIEREVNDYFNGRLKIFKTPLDLVGTGFQIQVWRQLQKIPYATTITYSQLAKQIKQACSAKDAAIANGNNKIAFAIPCHRVIGSDGELKGYGGGVSRKKWLLDLERVTEKHI